MVATVKRGPHPLRIAPPSLRMPREAITGAQVGSILCLADRLAQIREEVKAEDREAGIRRYIARCTGTVDTPVPAIPRYSARALATLLPSSERPITASRESCPRCQTRGDLGCPHQRPFGTSV